MKLVRTGPDKGPHDNGVEVKGRNAAMRLLLQKSAYDARIGHTQTAPKLAVQLSQPGHYGLFLVRKG